MENTATNTQIILSNYRPKPFPTKPQRVVEYENLDIKTRKSMNENGENYRGFWLDPEVKAYFDSRDNVIATNWSYRRFLLILRDEAIQKAKDTAPIDGILAQFRPDDYLFPVELRGQEDVPEEVRELASKVGGQVTNYKRREWSE